MMFVLMAFAFSPAWANHGGLTGHLVVSGSEQGDTPTVSIAGKSRRTKEIWFHYITRPKSDVLGSWNMVCTKRGNPLLGIKRKSGRIKGRGFGGPFVKIRMKRAVCESSMTVTASNDETWLYLEIIKFP